MSDTTTQSDHVKEIMSQAIVKTVAGVALFVVSVAAYVILSIEQPDADIKGIFTFAGVFAAYLGISGTVDTVKAQQAATNETVNTISHNTNGVLAQKIKDGVKDALAELGISANGSTPAQPDSSATVATAPAPVADASNTDLATTAITQEGK